MSLNGAVISMLSFSISYGLVKGTTRIKYNHIVGNNTSNHHINQALAAAGYGNLKIGRHGLKYILNEISKSRSIKIFDYLVDSVIDFCIGIQ